MIETHGKLIISGFIVILLGVILVQPIADDVEQLSVYSFNVSNESVSLSNVLEAITNESVTLSGETGTVTGNLANNNITVLSNLRNWTSEVFGTGLCNLTLSTGALVCNQTGNTTIFANYTHVYGKTGALSSSYDEWVSLDNLRNVSSGDIMSWCNFSTTSGTLTCNNTRSFLCYADYQYESDEYVTSRTARTMLSMTRLFFALAIMIFGAGMMWKGFQIGGVM